MAEATHAVPDVTETDLTRDELEAAARDLGIETDGLDDQELLERLGIELGEIDDTATDEATENDVATTKQRIDPDEVTRDELRDELREQGLPTSGSKRELAARLDEARDQAEQAGDEAASTAKDAGEDPAGTAARATKKATRTAKKGAKKATDTAEKGAKAATAEAEKGSKAATEQAGEVADEATETAADAARETADEVGGLAEGATEMAADASEDDGALARLRHGLATGLEATASGLETAATVLRTPGLSVLPNLDPVGRFASNVGGEVVDRVKGLFGASDDEGAAEQE